VARVFTRGVFLRNPWKTLASEEASYKSGAAHDLLFEAPDFRIY
jgi:hypothetical protein